MNLSVVICTRNRAVMLREFIGPLAAQVERVSGELLIIDNLSSDDTRDVVESTQSECVKYYLCEEPGLSKARNAGVGLARGEIVAFLDDDSEPCENWAEAVISAFSEPSVDALGGRTILKWPQTRPKWFPVEFERYLAPYDRGASRFEITDSYYPVGANMAFRRSVFERFGLFDARLGYSGEAKVGWEDIELIKRTARRGGKIIYDPEAFVYHHVGADKTTRAYLKKRLYAEGYGSVYFENISDSPDPRAIRAACSREWKKALATGLFLIRYALRRGSMPYKFRLDALRQLGRAVAAWEWYLRAGGTGARSES